MYFTEVSRIRGVGDRVGIGVFATRPNRFVEGCRVGRNTPRKFHSLPKGELGFWFSEKSDSSAGGDVRSCFCEGNRNSGLAAAARGGWGGGGEGHRPELFRKEEAYQILQRAGADIERYLFGANLRTVAETETLRSRLTSLTYILK